MKILYATDLHGSLSSYRNLIDIAVAEKVDMCINGGDMLPKGSPLYQVQFTWINYSFADFIYDWGRFVKKPYIFMTGNDDLSCFDDYLIEASRSSGFFKFLKCEEIYPISGLHLVGFNIVKDYPFRLKDRCALDDSDSFVGEQYGPGLASNIGGKFIEFPDWVKEVKSRLTIEERLDSVLASVEYLDNVVFVCHNPPKGYGLDVLYNGEQVGSRSISKFINDANPILSLHGHIHESPRVTGISHAIHENGTVMVQPGQESKLKYSIIELDNAVANKIVVKKVRVLQVK